METKIKYILGVQFVTRLLLSISNINCMATAAYVTSVSKCIKTGGSSVSVFQDGQQVGHGGGVAGV